MKKNKKQSHYKVTLENKKQLNKDANKALINFLGKLDEAQMISIHSAIQLELHDKKVRKEYIEFISLCLFKCICGEVIRREEKK